MKRFIKLILVGYSQIFLSEDWRIGAFICGLTLVEPNIGLAGLLSVLTTVASGWTLGMRQPHQWPSQYARNAILIGLSIGYVFRLDPATLPLVMTASIGTFMLTVSITRWLGTMFVPVVSLPFSIASIGISLASRHYSNLFNLESIHAIRSFVGPDEAPVFLKGFFQALSYVAFQKHFWVGALIAAMILSYSRILFLALFLGYMLGCSAQATMTGSWDMAFMNPSTFNYAYAAACTAGIFLIPSPVSIVTAIVAVLLSVIFMDGFTNLLSIWGLPISALPFNLSVIFTMHTLVYFNSKWRTQLFGRSPEESFEKLDSRVRRFGFPDISINLPFAGEWKVFQGFKGGMTHQGQWQYALDFVRSENKSESILNSAQGLSLDLDSSPTFAADVLAPCSGYIVALENSVPDNPIGKLNESKNWGNYIMIRADGGFHVSLCHLKKHSIDKAVGTYVQAGQLIGKCGNSGYSAEPHLHIQLQWLPYFSAATIPFRLSSYIAGNEIRFNKTPSAGDVITPVSHNKALDYAFAWPSGRKFLFQVKAGDKDLRQEALTVVTDPITGRNFLRDEHENQLFFWQEHCSFYFYDYRGSQNSILAKLFAAAPRIPLTYGAELHFDDIHPPGIAWGCLLDVFAQFARLLGFKTKATGSYKVDASGTKVMGSVRYRGKIVETSAIIDPNHGIKWFKVGTDEFSQVAS